MALFPTGLTDCCTTCTEGGPLDAADDITGYRVRNSTPVGAQLSVCHPSRGGLTLSRRPLGLTVRETHISGQSLPPSWPNSLGEVPDRPGGSTLMAILRLPPSPSLETIL